MSSSASAQSSSAASARVNGAASSSNDAHLFKEFEAAYAALMSTLPAEDTLFDRLGAHKLVHFYCKFENNLTKTSEVCRSVDRKECGRWMESDMPSALAKNSRSPETIAQEEEGKILHFMELARSLENFFLERRLLLHSHKPELVLKDDTMELKKELQAKDELLRRHFDKLSQWQALLQDMPASGGQQQQQQQQQQVRPPPAGAAVSSGPGAPMQPGMGAPQGGFVPGNSYRMPVVGGPRGGMMMMGGTGQDPLSYLEKSTGNAGR